MYVTHADGTVASNFLLIVACIILSFSAKQDLFSTDVNNLKLSYGACFGIFARLNHDLDGL